MKCLNYNPILSSKTIFAQFDAERGLFNISVTFVTEENVFYKKIVGVTSNNYKLGL